MAEDLTDKFDYTFIFGDLNFRLDISRLHADWLISRQGMQPCFHFIFTLSLQIMLKRWPSISSGI